MLSELPLSYLRKNHQQTSTFSTRKTKGINKRDKNWHGKRGRDNFFREKIERKKWQKVAAALTKEINKSRGRRRGRNAKISLTTRRSDTHHGTQQS